MSGLAEDVAEGVFRSGVRALFGVPGSGASYQVIAHLLDRGVPYYGASHEGSAAIAAGAFGRQSGSIGCSVSIKGPGLANMLPGIASNHFERLPTLSIAEATGPLTPRGRVHKRLDHQLLLSGLVKAYATPGDGAGTISRLVQCATREIPGPVHLDLVAGNGHSFVEFASAEHQGEPTARAWGDVVRLVEHSTRPLLIVGAMGRRQLWRERLAHLRLPVLTSLAAKGILDERLPHAAGVFTGDGGTLSPEYSLLHETDLVVGLGLRNFEILNPSALSGPLVLVDNVQSDAGIGFAASAACSSATPEQIGELLDCLGSRSWGLDATGSAHAVLRRRLLDHPWLPPALFAVLEDLLPHAVFVADTGAFCTVAEHLWRARDQDGFLCSANGRYMGTSVPMAIGAALAQPERPVICAMGDGGVRIYFPEIKLALQHKLPILFLLLSDGCYGSIAAAVPAAQRRAEVLSIGKPSWVEAGIALGCPGARVEDGAALRAMVKQWRTADGPSFLEAHFDPNAYLTMTEGLR